MTHFMKLHEKPFLQIQSHKKTIEMRLNDEKRKQLQIDDYICFTNTKTNEEMITKVIGLFVYKDFFELYQHYDKKDLGYQKNEESHPEDMYAYYSFEKIEQNGVLAIQIEVIEPKKAYFAGGCFWCISGAFMDVLGVIKVQSGYAGGTMPNPTYFEVKKQITDYRETICIIYDKKKISFEKLFDIYLENIDPFDPNGQFIDVGFSYTLAIFYQLEEERILSENKIKILEEKSDKKVHVSILPFTTFFLAEDEHQDFKRKNKEAYEKEQIISGRRDYFKNKK